MAQSAPGVRQDPPAQTAKTALMAQSARAASVGCPVP